MKWQIQSGELDGVFKGHDPEVALVMEVRKRKLPKLGRLFRWRECTDGGLKVSGAVWKYQDTVDVLQRFNLLVK